MERQQMSQGLFPKRFPTPFLGNSGLQKPAILLAF
jgi:hypothetical protein